MAVAISFATFAGIATLVIVLTAAIGVLKVIPSRTGTLVAASALIAFSLTFVTVIGGLEMAQAATAVAAVLVLWVLL